MPARLVDPDFTEDVRLIGVPFSAQVLWHRLMSKVDDHQCFRADPLIVKAACFPLDRTVTDEHVAKWLSALKDANLVTLYMAGKGLDYLQLVESPLRIRYEPKKRKHPPPSVVQVELELSDSRENYKIFPLVGDESESKSKVEVESGAGARPDGKGNRTRALSSKGNEERFARDEWDFEGDDLWRDLIGLVGLREMTANGAAWERRFKTQRRRLANAVQDVKAKTPEERAKIGNVAAYLTALFDLGVGQQDEKRSQG